MRKPRRKCRGQYAREERATQFRSGREARELRRSTRARERERSKREARKISPAVAMETERGHGYRVFFTAERKPIPLPGGCGQRKSTPLTTKKMQKSQVWSQGATLKNGQKMEKACAAFAGPFLWLEMQFPTSKGYIIQTHFATLSRQGGRGKTMQLLPFDRARIFEEHSPHFLRHFFVHH